MALWFDHTGDGELTIRSPASGDYTLVFPITAGSIGQFLQTDGSGNLSWSSATTEPAGNDTEVQYNDNGSFAGSSAFTFDNTTNALSIGGSLFFTSTGSRIVGDFTNNTISNRLLLQTSTTDGKTDVGIVPNGVSTSSQLTLYSNNTTTNATTGGIEVNGTTDVRVFAGITDTGTHVPLTFYTNNTEAIRINTAGQLLVSDGGSSTPGLGFRNEISTGLYRPGNGVLVLTAGGSEVIRTDSTQNVVVGTDSLITTATDGFLYIPGVAGTPTGTPSSFGGHHPIVYDNASNKMYVYDAGWVDIGSSGGVSMLNDLTDVSISSPNNGQVLKYNGSTWINDTDSTAVSWGSISGTLANQTDLKNALDAKLDVTTAGTTYVAKAGDTMTGTLNLPSNGLVVGTTELVVSGGNVSTSGTITHNGLVPSAGTEIDQVTQFTKSITLTTNWQDTGIKSTDLATGTYIIQLYANDAGSGGTNNNEYYSGTMSWYSGTTDSSNPMPTDEIVLHRAGGSGDGQLYLRTYRTALADPDDLKLQIFSNSANISASNYVFKFRRML